jgi:hypothetical protein
MRAPNNRIQQPAGASDSRKAAAPAWRPPLLMRSVRYPRSK